MHTIIYIVGLVVVIGCSRQCKGQRGCGCENCDRTGRFEREFHHPLLDAVERMRGAGALASRARHMESQSIGTT